MFYPFVQLDFNSLPPKSMVQCNHLPFCLTRKIRKFCFSFTNLAPFSNLLQPNTKLFSFSFLPPNKPTRTAPMIHFYFSLSNCSLRLLMRGKRTCSMRWLNYSGGITNDICPEIFILHHYLILISLKLLLVICRLICAQEEIQKFKTENAQVNFCWSLLLYFISLEPNAWGC